MSTPERWLSISKLRYQTATSLRELSAPLVLHSRDEPLAVLIPYDLFLLAQHAIEAFHEARHEQGEPPTRHNDAVRAECACSGEISHEQG